MNFWLQRKEANRAQQLAQWNRFPLMYLVLTLSVFALASAIAQHCPSVSQRCSLSSLEVHIKPSAKIDEDCGECMETVVEMGCGNVRPKA